MVVGESQVREALEKLPSSDLKLLLKRAGISKTDYESPDSKALADKWKNLRHFGDHPIPHLSPTLPSESPKSQTLCCCFSSWLKHNF